MTVENEHLQSLEGDQRRETVNTRQRFDVFRDAKARADAYRGSMVFATVNGGDGFPRGIVAVQRRCSRPSARPTPASTIDRPASQESRAAERRR